jgi:RHS repeat-associated protein
MKKVRSKTRFLLVLTFLFSLSSSSSDPQDFTTPPSKPGESSTLLPDGHWLLLGGEASDGLPSSAASIWNPVTHQSSSLSPLTHARAWHTATMLPDGTVFIFGGVGRDGKIVEQAEIYDPETQVFEILPSTGLSPRARHTATLLTDGQVLIAGGLSADGKALNEAELWDFQDGATLRVPSELNEARYNHAATLLADGTVHLSGGLDKDGNVAESGDLFDPFSERFTPISASEIQSLKSKSDHVELAASLPLNGATDVPVDSLIAIRFSTVMRVETVDPDTVILSGPDGPVTIKVIPAEVGMLGFITPETVLLPGTIYTVILNGPVARDGRLLPVSSFSFTTEQSSASGQPSDRTSASSSSESSIQNPKSEIQNGESDDLVWRGEWKDGKPHSKWQDLPPLQAAPGETALAGQVLDLKGEPLANVTLEMGYGSEEVKVKTDDTGRFLLEYVETGWSELLIDGRRAHNPKSGVEDPKWGYGIFEYGSPIVEGETNVLPFTIWLPKIDVAHTATIPSPTTSEVVVTTPKISGLEVHIPPNAVIYDYDGKATNEINITPIPQDRTPFPLPKGVVTPALFTIQPGAGYISGSSQGVRLVYPNYASNPLRPGTRFNFWHYNPEYKGWYVYGLGTVTENGKQIVPDPGISVYEFTGAMVAPPSMKPAEGKQCRDSSNCDKGEPVDLQTGIFQTTKTDLFLPDVMPIKFTRTYRTRDTASRAFGIGASHSYDYFLIGDTFPYTFQEVVFPDGGTIHYNRIDGGAGNDFTVAVYEHTSAPGPFYKSQISWNGNGWNLKLKDGTLYVFRDSLGATRPGQAGIIRIQDRNGNAQDITRDANGNVTKITSSPSGRWIELTNDTSNRITQAKDNTGRTVTYTYDGTGRLSTVTDPNGGITTYTYDGSQRMLTITDPRQILFLTNEYDPTTGRVTKQTQADTTTYLFAYTLNGSNVIQTDVTDPRGNVSRVTFNADSQILTNSEPVGTPDEQLTTYERQATTNLLLSVTDALNRKMSYTYDTMGNMLSITRLADTPDAVATTYTYEPAFNQVVTSTDPLNHTTTFGYDAKGNLTSITNPLNRAITYTYNTAGQPISITDPLNNATQFTYNLGDLVSVSDPLGNVTTRFTDAVGRLLSLKNPVNNVTLYDYDTLNRVTKVTDPLGGQTQFGFDPNGNLLSVTDARNNTTSYVYDNMDRLATRTDPLLHGESSVYDNNGNLSQFTDRKSQVTGYTYDALNHRTGVTYADTSTTTYTYDNGNRLLQIDDSISGTITRAYDGLNRLTTETTPQGSISYTYDNAGRRATMTVSGQPTTTYAYDNANRLTQITQASSIVIFGYDAAGRRTSLTLPNGILVEYAYDAASRVTGITYKQGVTVLGNLTYTYDAAGNRTQTGGSFARMGIPQAISSTAYNIDNQQLTFGDKTLGYDNNGNLTFIVDANGTTLYTWDARNRLVGLSGPSTTASFVYDGMARREKKTINGNLTEFLYDGVNPVQETSGATVLANILGGLGIDEPFSRADVPAGTTSHLLSDALGSVIAASDLSGTAQTEYSYEPFGRTTVTGVSDTNSFQYTGRENDGTGLYQYRNRFYHPGLQRFISEDPLEFGGGDYNLYSYVQNSPIMMRDPLGLIVTCSPTGNRTFWEPWGHTVWRKTNEEGPGQDFPFAPLYCYWELVAPGYDVTIKYEICSDSCKKLDWIRETRTDTPSERILGRKATPWRHALPIPGGVTGLVYICDSP